MASSHHPEEALLGEIAVQPIAAGAGLVHKDQLSALGVEPADELVDVGLAGPDGTEVEHRRPSHRRPRRPRWTPYRDPDRRTVC